MPWHSDWYRRVLLSLKRQSLPARRIIRDRKGEAAIFLWLLLVTLLFPKLLPFGIIDVSTPLIYVACLSIALILFFGARLIFERRPVPLQSRREVQKLVETIFRIENDTVKKKLMHFQIGSYRSIAPTDSLALIEIMTRLNCQLFMHSVHGQLYEEKLARNRAHVEKHPNVIHLLGMNATGRKRIADLTSAEVASIPAIQRMPWIGFSHILPISEATYREYVRPHAENIGIEDVAFSAEHICPVGTRAYAFLLFTVALDGQLVRRWETPQFEGIKSMAQRHQRREILVQAEQCLYLMTFDHLRKLVKLHNHEDRECRILAQAMLPSTARTLEKIGFKKIDGTRSADDEPIYETVVEFEQ